MSEPAVTAALTIFGFFGCVGCCSQMCKVNREATGPWWNQPPISNPINDQLTHYVESTNAEESTNDRESTVHYGNMDRT